MNSLAEAQNANSSSPADSELFSGLERALNNFLAEGAGAEEEAGGGRRITKLSRRPSDYRSSFNLEELKVFLDDGQSLRVMFKDVSWNTLLEGGRRLKPKFIYDPRREIDVYGKILPAGLLGTARCYGWDVDEQAGRYWLFLEKVPGVELYQVGEFEMWLGAARWLAGFHAFFAEKTEGLSSETSLLKYDELFYRGWLNRAKTFHSNDAQAEAEKIKKQLEWLDARYDRVVEHLMRMPHTFIHGEFYASNVLVSGSPTGTGRVCPIDWEMSGVGPCLIDLAALTGGNWNDAEKAALAGAYYEALPERTKWFASEDDFRKALGFCQLYSAVQWTGWFGRRNPFGPHAQDWLGEAVDMAESLGL